MTDAQKAAHTPGPLIVQKIGNDYDQHVLYAEGGDGHTVCNTVYGKANAARLALCWNTHDALLDACEALSGMIGVACTCHQGSIGSGPCAACLATEIGRKAIALATD